jgi:hypothetical protein
LHIPDIGEGTIFNGLPKPDFIGQKSALKIVKGKMNANGRLLLVRV